MPGLTATQRRQIAEATYTPAAFVAHLLATGAKVLPGRRYRVEHSEPGQGGNSHLLSLEEAKAAQSVYGGTIVELVSAASFYRATASRHNTACDDCHAPPKEPCVDAAGGACAPHTSRSGRLTLADRAARDLPACAICGASASRCCRDARGCKRMPHQQRRPPKPAKDKKPRVAVKDLGPCETCKADAGLSCRSTSYSGDGRPPIVKPHAGRPRRSESL